MGNMTRCGMVAGLVLTLATALMAQGVESFDGRKTQWNGYDCYEFALQGRSARVVVPKQEAPGRPWVWRARFFGHRPEPDLALLKQGYYVGYIDCTELMGSPKAVALWDAFYDLLVKQHGLAPKPAIIAMSRGGLYSFNWAERNPSKVACIYADAPVLDFKSWPGGKLKHTGRGQGSAEVWRQMMAAYGFKSDAEALAYKLNPVDNLKPLAEARVPILFVTGDADDVVPMEENCALALERYRALGGKARLIVKPGIGHKHGLDDPKPLIDFLLEHTRAEQQPERPPQGR